MGADGGSPSLLFMSDFTVSILALPARSLPVVSLALSSRSSRVCSRFSSAWLSRLLLSPFCMLSYLFSCSCTNYADDYTDEDYWLGHDDYDYATWLYETPDAPTGPVIFSFNFDPTEVNAWLEQQEGLYDAFNTRYTDEWNAYFERVVPIYEQIDGENNALAARLESIDALTEEQLNSTFYDIGQWLEDSFSAD